MSSAHASYRSPPSKLAGSFISLRFLSLHDRSLCSLGHVAGFGCSLFRSHPELSLNEALNFLRTSVNKSPRLPNRSPAQRVRFGRGRRSQRNVVFARFSLRENEMQLASSDVQSGFDFKTIILRFAPCNRSVFARRSPALSPFLSEKWWAKVDSNHRPHDYQSCALAS